MLGRSARFDAAVRDGATPITRMEIWRDGELVASDATVDAGARIAGLTVTLDATAAIGGRIEFTVSDPHGNLLPDHDWWQVLSRYEFRPLQGFLYPDGAEETIGLGWYGIADRRLAYRAAEATLRVVAHDRARLLRRRRTAPYTIAAGQDYVEAIRFAILDRDPHATFGQVGSTSHQTPRLIFDENRDPLDSILEMARGIGFYVAVTADDTYDILPVPVPTGDTVADWVEAAGAGGVEQLDVAESNEQAYNGYIVVGEASGVTPVRGEAWDDNPDSPTYRLGPYGERPAPIEVSATVRTVAQAQEAALRLLADRLGATQQIGAGMVPHPALRARDVIELDYPEVGVTGLHVLDRVDTRLDPSSYSTSLTLRERRVLR